MPRLHHRIPLFPAVAYLVGLACVAFWPTPVDQPVSGTLAELIRWLHARGMPRSIGYGTIECAANIALFASFGYVMASASGRTWWRVALLGGAVSCFIELGQALLLPDRFPSAWDILANTLGAALGAGIFAAAHVRGRAGHRAT